MTNKLHYHLIGDQGISMRGLAKYLKHLGHMVTGSDLKTGGHKAENITSDIDVVVRTSAVNPGSEGWLEVEAAKKKGIRIIKRSELIGELTKDKKLIAISGMHGKTTITSMAGLVLEVAGFDPTVLVGDEVPGFNNNVIRIGESDWFVLEACEYDRSFLDFCPRILILTNIEEEHLDTYPGGLAEIKEAFRDYINHVPDDGLIIACADDDNVKAVLSDIKTKARIIYYGFSSEKYNQLDYKLAIPGQHNILNALSVVALSDYLGINRELVRNTLSNFQGAHRRFELKGNFKEADLIDDYGHHPTEIETTIAALSERYPDKKKIVVFWPHQYKRILPLLDKFAAAFKKADEVIILPIFFVPGRDEVLDVKSEDLVEKINQLGVQASYGESVDRAAEIIRDKLDRDSVLLTIGIPPVYQVIEKILGEK